MNFIKKLFGYKDKPVEQPTPPSPIVEPPKPNISAPVYGFVKCVKEHPKRFKVEGYEGNNFEWEEHIQTLTITDKLTQIKWEVVVGGVYFYGTFVNGRPIVDRHVVVEGIKLTLDEKLYLLKQLIPIFERKAAKDRLARMNKSRVEREDKANRAKWAEEYPE